MQMWNAQNASHIYTASTAVNSNPTTFLAHSEDRKCEKVWTLPSPSGCAPPAQISTMRLERLLGKPRLFGKRPAGNLEALVDTTGAGDFEAVLKLT